MSQTSDPSQRPPLEFTELAPDVTRIEAAQGETNRWRRWWEIGGACALVVVMNGIFWLCDLLVPHPLRGVPVMASIFGIASGAMLGWVLQRGWTTPDQEILVLDKPGVLEYRLRQQMEVIQAKDVEAVELCTDWGVFGASAFIGIAIKDRPERLHLAGRWWHPQTERGARQMLADAAQELAARLSVPLIDRQDARHPEDGQD